MDPFTLSHLTKWINNQFRSDEPRETIMKAMVAVVETDPEHWTNRGWWDVYDACRDELTAATTALNSVPWIEVDQETAYGRTSRLSNAIRVF